MSSRLRERDQKLFAATFVLLAIAALMPLWRVRFLPLLDEPNHLSSVYILHYFNQPWARLSEFYELNILPVPYIAYHLLLHITAYATGIEIANKLVLSAYVLSIPIAALLWTRRTRRSPWLSVLTFPLAYSYAWSYGFQPFNIGVSFFLFATVAFDAFLEQPRWTSGILAALLAIACDLCHPLMVLALYACLPVLLIAHRPRLRVFAASLLLLLPGAALFAWQVLRPKVSWIARTPGPLYEGAHLGVGAMVKSLPTYTLDSVAGDFDRAVFAVLAGSFALLLVIGLSRAWKAPAAGLTAALRYYRTALLAIVMLALYLIVPLHLSRPFDWWFVSGRYAPLLCFFAFLSPGFEIRGLRRALLVPAVLAALALPIHISSRYADFNDRARPFIRMVERTRPGANVLFLSMKPRGDEAVNVEAYNQFAAWIQIMRGGFSGSGWFNLDYPFKVKKSLPGPPWFNQERFDPATHAGPYAYVIVRNENKRRPIFDVRAPASEWRLVDEEGAWKMYARADEP